MRFLPGRGGGMPEPRPDACAHSCVFRRCAERGLRSTRRPSGIAHELACRRRGWLALSRRGNPARVRAVSALPPGRSGHEQAAEILSDGLSDDREAADCAWKVHAESAADLGRCDALPSVGFNPTDDRRLRPGFGRWSPARRSVPQNHLARCERPAIRGDRRHSCFAPGHAP
jgi:hypothetical protein